MPGKHITQSQETLYMKNRQTGCSQEISAAKAGISVQGGPEYIALNQTGIDLTQRIVNASTKKAAAKRLRPHQIRKNVNNKKLLVRPNGYTRRGSSLLRKRLMQTY